MAKQITEKQIEQIIEKLIDRIEQANTYFLESIGSSIKTIRDLTPSQAQQLVNILKYGGSYDDIVKKISQFMNMNVQDIELIFKNYAKKDQLFNKQFYKYRNIPFVEYAENEVLKRQTMALANITKQTMQNFTNSRALGYTIRDIKGNIQFLGLRQTYERVLDEALLNVGTGKQSFDTAMTRIMKEIGGSGLKTVQFQSGRNMRLDSAVRMHLQDSLRNLHNENQQLFGEEFGADGVEISVHSNPAPDHADIQGRQFSTVKHSKNELSDWEKIQAGEKVKDYTGVYRQLEHSKSGGYRPISEYNCYHYVFSIVLGASKPEYSDEQLQQIIDDTNKKIEFEGKEYNKYECTQLQRNLERRIREQKDIQILARAGDNTDLIGKSQENIRILTNKYKNLSKASELPIKADRLRVSNYRRIKVK